MDQARRRTSFSAGEAAGSRATRPASRVKAGPVASHLLPSSPTAWVMRAPPPLLAPLGPMDRSVRVEAVESAGGGGGGEIGGGGGAAGAFSTSTTARDFAADGGGAGGYCTRGVATTCC